MSVKLEWMHADHCVIRGLIAGETAADNQELDLDGNPIALQIIDDDGVLIFGDRENLINLGQRIIEMAIRTDDRYENRTLKEDLDDSLEDLRVARDEIPGQNAEFEALQNALDNALALLGMDR